MHGPRQLLSSAYLIMGGLPSLNNLLFELDVRICDVVHVVSSLLDRIVCDQPSPQMPRVFPQFLLYFTCLPLRVSSLSISKPSPPASVSFASFSPVKCSLQSPSASVTSRLPSPPQAISAASAVEVDDEEDVDLGDDVARDYPPFAAFRIHGTGRRKTAVARVGLIEGTGNFIVNDLPVNEYFQNQALMIQVRELQWRRKRGGRGVALG